MLNRAQMMAFTAVLCFSVQPTAVHAERSPDIYRILLSTAANYQPGQKLKSATVVELKKGEKLRLKAQKTREKCTLNGPYKGKVKCPDFIKNLNRLVPQTRNQVKKKPSDLWALDVSSSGDFCYDQDKSLTLWRTDASQTETVLLRDRDKSAESTLQWMKGQHRLSWPAEDVSIRDNGRYQLKREGDIHYATLHILPTSLNRPSDKSVWMAQQGCTKQINMLFAAESPRTLFD